VIEKLTLKNAVEFAIKTEQLGAKLYGGLAMKYAGHDELRQLFEGLARDEVAHENQFKDLRDKLPEDEQGELSEADSEYLMALSKAELFFGGHAQLDSVDSIVSAEDALQRAYQLEHSSLLYYKAMEEVLGPSEVLQEIIDAERQHLLQVMRYAVTGAKMRGLSDEF
jgi:rubrerythrin